MRTYGHVRLLPGDLGYTDCQYDVDQAAEREREAARMQRERFDPPPAPATSEEDAVEESVDAYLLRSAVERAVARLDAIAAREEWGLAPWGVRFDVTTVLRNLRAVLVRGA